MKTPQEMQYEFMSFGKELGINKTELERQFNCARRYTSSVLYDIIKNTEFNDPETVIQIKLALKKHGFVV